MDKKAFVSELVKLADDLDQKGLAIEATELDQIVKEAGNYIMDSSRDRRERGTHLPSWRKMQLEREEEEKKLEEEEDPEKGKW